MEKYTSHLSVISPVYQAEELIDELPEIPEYENIAL